MSDATIAATPQATSEGAAPQAGDGQQQGQLTAGQGQPPQASPTPAPKTPDKVVPEKYDLKLPEESPFDAQHLEKIAAYAKERGFSQEEAQAFLERDHSVLKAYVDQRNEEFNTTRNEWIETLKADKEIGGDNMPKSVEMARRALDRFGSKSLKEELNRTGLGDHPELVRLLARIGKVMANDATVLGSSSVDARKSVAELLYGNTTKEK